MSAIIPFIEGCFIISHDASIHPTRLRGFCPAGRGGGMRREATARLAAEAELAELRARLRGAPASPANRRALTPSSQGWQHNIPPDACRAGGAMTLADVLCERGSRHVDRGDPQGDWDLRARCAGVAGVSATRRLRRHSRGP